MPKRLILALGLALAALPAAAAPAGSAPASHVSGAAAPADGIAWRPFDDSAFADAARENKFIILHMAAVWCHWCHVMENVTYRDPEVLKLIREKFITVRVDQDSRPDLSYRYERWGWPATIMFDKDGNEILKRQGYVPPEVYAKLLKIVVEDPSALPDQAMDPEADLSKSALAADKRRELETTYLARYDREHGGFGEVHRFIQGEALEYALLRAQAGPSGNAEYKDVVTRTLAGARRLIDPVWGGMYQYSDKLDWSSPHYEKIMQIQAQAIRIHAAAYAAFHDPADLAAARDVARYVTGVLQAPEGGFRPTQDADLNHDVHGEQYYALDDAGRRKLGIPRVDPALYARETGWAVGALAFLSDVSGDPAWLAAARRGAEWALANRRTPAGTFAHNGAAVGDAYLADTLAMGEAFLGLYRATGERRWLTLADETARATAAAFADPRGGFMAQRPPEDARGALKKPVKQLEENVAAVRFFNLVHAYTARPEHKAMAEQGMAWLAAVAEEGVLFPGALLADAEMTREPVHVAVIGAKGDRQAAALYAEARRFSGRYLRIEWIDRAEGPMPNTDVEYPDLPEAAAFTCANRLCSLPVFEADGVAGALRTVAQR